MFTCTYTTFTFNPERKLNIFHSSAISVAKLTSVSKTITWEKTLISMLNSYRFEKNLWCKTSKTFVVVFFFKFKVNSFFLWNGVLKHYKYVEVKQFSIVNIKQNNVFTIILLINFLIYQWDPCHLQGNCVVYNFVYTMKSMFSLISYHFFVHFNH